MSRDLADGEETTMQGSAKAPYVLRNVGGVYSCSCPAWRNQGRAIDLRTCKHLKKLRGEAAEAARVGADAVRRGPVRKAKSSSGGADEAIKLVPLHQQLAGPPGIGLGVRGCCRRWRKVGTNQPGFAISKLYVGFGDLRRSCTQALDLPTFEHKPSLEFALDKVIVARFAVDSDHAIAARLGFF